MSIAVEPLCPKCRCPFHAADRFCVDCGHQLLSADIVVSPRRFYVPARLAAGNTGRDPDGLITIRNTGVQQLSIYPLQIAPEVDWLEFDGAATGGLGDPPVVLEASASVPYELPFAIRLPDACPPEGLTARLVVRTSASESDHEVSVMPVPELSPTPVRLIVERRGHMPDQSIPDAKLTPAKGVELKELRIDCQGIEELPPTPPRLEPDGALHVSLRPRPHLLPAEGGLVRGQIKVYIADLPDPLDWPVELLVKRPPRLELSGSPKLGRPLYTEEEEPVNRPFEITNVGDLPAQIERIELVDSLGPEGQSVTYAELHCDPAIGRGTRLGPGDKVSGQVRYLQTGLPPASYSLFLVVESLTAERLEIDLGFTVKPMPEAELVAIDFGTTNSCIGWVDEDTDFKPELVTLATSERGMHDTLPSVIHFIDTGEPPVYQVGREASAYMRTAGMERQVIHSIKRRLGRRRPEEIWIEGKPLKEYSPAQVAGFILKDLIRRMKRETLHKPGDVTITVPPTFSEAQISVLKEACALAGLDLGRLSTLPEPVAAAMEFILELGQRPDPATGQRYELGEKYVLAVCDAGGGTTDLCLIHVEDRHPEGEPRQVDLKLLFAGGNPRFGGNDITDSMADLLYERAEEEKREEYGADFRLLFPIAERGGVAQVVWTNNWHRLWNRAEETKVVLSEQEEVNDVEVTLQRTGPTIGTSDEITVSIAAVSTPDLEGRVQDDLRLITDTLEKAGERPADKTLRRLRPHVLLFAGQSSKMAVLREEVRKACPDAQIVWREVECKRCVALGALRYGIIEKYGDASSEQ